MLDEEIWQTSFHLRGIRSPFALGEKKWKKSPLPRRPRLKLGTQSNDEEFDTNNEKRERSSFRSLKYPCSTNPPFDSSWEYYQLDPARLVTETSTAITSGDLYRWLIEEGSQRNRLVGKDIRLLSLGTRSSDCSQFRRREREREIICGISRTIWSLQKWFSSMGQFRR